MPGIDARRIVMIFSAALFACAATAVFGEQSPRELDAELLARIDRGFDDYRLDAHIPGMVYGLVIDGRLAHVRGVGWQDIDSRRPVTPDTLFRIASMTKSFTALAILKLRDEGKLALDAPAGLVPDLGGPTVYPLADLVRSYLDAQGKHRLLVPVRIPGKAARAVREGAVLAPDRAVGERSWEEFLAGLTSSRSSALPS